MKKLAVYAAATIAMFSTQASAERLFGLTSVNTIVSFDSAAPGAIVSTGAISGIAVCDTLTGLDLRPQDGRLYSVGTSGNIYRLDRTGPLFSATLIADIGNVQTGASVRYGIDFNPMANALRFVNSNDQNFRYSFTTSIATVDGTIGGNPNTPDQKAFTAVAYTNNVAGATSTQLYAIDATGNQLQLSTNPNAGTYPQGTVITLNGQALDFGGANNVGFDISGLTGTAYLNIGSALYTLDLATAQATAQGQIGASLIGLTAGAVPEPASWAMMIGGAGLVGGAMRRRRAAGPRLAIA